MSEKRNFYAPNLHLETLIDALKDWYRSQNFNVQALEVHGGGILIQANKGGWRNLVGMASALNVVLHQNDIELTVEVGAGKWLDKVGAGAVSIVVLWPLAVTAAWGAWQQSQLPKQTFEFIEQQISFGGSSLDSESEEQKSVTSGTIAHQFCPNCGFSLSESDRFCSNCGSSLQ